MVKKGVTKARRRDFAVQPSELWGNKNDLSAQLQIQLVGFEPNLSHFPFLKSRRKKLVFRTFWGLSGGGTQLGLQRVVHTCVTTKCNVHDKSHPETRTSHIESVICGWQEL